MFLKKIQAGAFRNMVFKNLFDITASGVGFLKSGGSVGDRISIKVLADDMSENVNNQLDKLRSGDFLVYNTRHQFAGVTHNVAMTVAKLEAGDRNE